MNDLSDTTQKIKSKKQSAVYWNTWRQRQY